jgi:hypothetical protein
VELIDDLEGACIRFVHFSKENELRSRVFSEKMGLEAGWNCHISLLSEADMEAETSRGGASHSTLSANSGTHLTPRSVDSFHINHKRVPSANSRERHNSAPSAVHLEMSHVKFDTETEKAEEILPHVSSPLLQSHHSSMDEEIDRIEASMESFPASHITSTTDSTGMSFSNRVTYLLLLFGPSLLDCSCFCFVLCPEYCFRYGR